MKRDISDILKIEYSCKKCESSLSFSIDDFKTAPLTCPMCGAMFKHFGKDDPVIMLNEALKALKSTTNADISFICKVEE